MTGQIESSLQALIRQEIVVNHLRKEVAGIYKKIMDILDRLDVLEMNNDRISDQR